MGRRRSVSVPRAHQDWLDEQPRDIRIGPVGEVAYTQRLAQALATANAGGLAAFNALAGGLRRSVRALLDGLPIVYVATPTKGPDLIVAAGHPEKIDSWMGIAVEHKRLGNAHARPRAYYQQWWPNGDLRTDSARYDFSKRREAYTLRGQEGMWQLDAARCYPSDWLPDEVHDMTICGWLFLDAESRAVSDAYNYGDDPDPDLAACPPQTADDWDALGYDAFSAALIAAHRSLIDKRDISGAATLAPLLTALYHF